MDELIRMFSELLIFGYSICAGPTPLLRILDRTFPKAHPRCLHENRYVHTIREAAFVDKSTILFFPYRIWLRMEYGSRRPQYTADVRSVCVYGLAYRTFRANIAKTWPFIQKHVAIRSNKAQIKQAISHLPKLYNSMLYLSIAPNEYIYCILSAAQTNFWSH